MKQVKLGQVWSSPAIQGKTFLGKIVGKHNNRIQILVLESKQPNVWAVGSVLTSPEVVDDLYEFHIKNGWLLVEESDLETPAKF